MVAIQAPVDKAKTYTPVWLRAVFTSDRGLARRQYRRVRINQLSGLYPEGQLREKALKFAKQFVDDMRKQGYDLLSAEADVLVSGPFRARGSERATSGPIKVAHHVRRGGEALALPVLGRQAAEEPFPDKEDFLLEAQFLSTRVRLVEHAIREDDPDAA